MQKITDLMNAYYATGKEFEMGKKCDNCGAPLDNDFSNYCDKCREDYHKRTAGIYETRPIDKK